MRCRFLFVRSRSLAALSRVRMRIRDAVLALASTLLAAACSRTPQEDFPPRASTSAAVVPPAAQSAVVAPPNPSAVSLVGRCVTPTPATAPAPVGPAGPGACPADPEGGPPSVPIVRVTFAGKSAVHVDAELVRTTHDTMRGLMYRTSLPEDHGMLFDLRVRDDHQFWMHNTCIPLDLLYVDQDGLVVGIVENAPVLDDTSRGVGCPSRYVLEVNAGWSRRHGIRAGQVMNIPSEVKSVDVAPPGY
jgi:uncharacterized membrane protein (UPF0127 family)